MHYRSLTKILLRFFRLWIEGFLCICLHIIFCTKSWLTVPSLSKNVAYIREDNQKYCRYCKSIDNKPSTISLIFINYKEKGFRFCYYKCTLKSDLQIQKHDCKAFIKQCDSNRLQWWHMRLEQNQCNLILSVSHKNCSFNHEDYYWWLTWS